MPSSTVQPFLITVTRAAWDIRWRHHRKRGNRSAEQLRRMLKVHGPLIGLHIDDRPELVEPAAQGLIWQPAPRS